MPVPCYGFSRAFVEPKPVIVGRPHRDRAKVKAARKASHKR